MYKAQVTSLKVALAQKEAEFKKVVESDRLKAQKIMTLNAELQEFRNTFIKETSTNISVEPSVISTNSNINDDKIKVHILELKTSNLEQLVNKLESKIDALQINVTTRNNLRDTYREPQPMQFPCKKCDFEAHTKPQLQEHYKEVHPQKQHPCDKCEFTTIQKGQLEKHMRTTHIPHKFQCDLCSYKGIHTNDLNRHINTMHSEEPFYCDKCDFETPDEKIIISHVNEVHKPENESRIFFSNTRKRNINTNNAANTRSQPFARPSLHNSNQDIRRIPSAQGNNLHCDSCEETFKARDHLDLHKAFYHNSANKNKQ